jgi:uncharacterized protein
MSEEHSPMFKPIKRRAMARVSAAIKDTRVVLVAGPRQAGKTTLVRLYEDKARPYFTLDNPATLLAAQDDPTGFIRALEYAIIDEVQRAPDLLLAIKESVDTDQRPGRFLLTGSANLATLPRVADSLAGRMEVIELLPFAQAEIRDSPGTFLEWAFSNDKTDLGGRAIVGDELADLIISGGYSEAISRKSPLRRQRWFENYIALVLDRDVRDISSMEQLDKLPKLLRLLAEQAGQIVNHSSYGAALSLSHVTAQRFVAILERLFLVRILQPWSNNEISRLIKSPKFAFLDCGLLSALRGAKATDYQSARSQFGPILENFVATELFKLASWNEEYFRFSHFRTREQEEVDLVIEDRRGRVVGIEVKARATVTPSDFRGLRRLQAAAGDRFLRGIVLHDHDKVTPFGERLHAMPVSRLWTQ